MTCTCLAQFLQFRHTNPTSLTHVDDLNLCFRRGSLSSITTLHLLTPRSLLFTYEAWGVTITCSFLKFHTHGDPSHVWALFPLIHGQLLLHPYVWSVNSISIESRSSMVVAHIYGNILSLLFLKLEHFSLICDFWLNMPSSLLSSG